MQEFIKKLVDRIDLTESEISKAIDTIMDGKASDSQIGAFLTALRMKGETIEELTACVKTMRRKAASIKPKVDFYIDTCGTGGDGTCTFNISTAAAFVAAAAGVNVAKHGNRSVSSMSGSADVLEALGIKVDLDPQLVCKCIEETGFGFMFAPIYHSSMRHVAKPRKEMGIRTVFNMLGPMSNPADAPGQLLGVYSKSLLEPFAAVLRDLGCQKAMVVYGGDGMDEITLTTVTYIAEINDGQITLKTLDPKEYGFNYVNAEDLRGGNSQENAQIIHNIFNGDKGAHTDICILNAAAAIYVGKKAENIEEGVQIARNMIFTGKAKEKMEQIINYTNILAEKADEEGA